MATVSAKVHEHLKKADGTYNVKICIHHIDQRKFIDTSHFVAKKQLTAKLKIKDNFVNNLIDDQLKGYRKIISEIGEKLNFFNAESLRDYLRDKDADVDFIKFCQLHIEQLKKQDRLNLVRYNIEKGLKSGTHNQPLPFIAIGTFYIKSLSDYQAAIGPNRDTIRADFSNYTNIIPVILVSEVVR